MNFFAHVATSIGLFFGSVFGLHANVMSSTTPVVPVTGAVVASTTVSAPASAKPSSFFGKVAALVAPAPSAPATATVPAAPSAGQSTPAAPTPTASAPSPAGTATIDQTGMVQATPVKEDSEFYINTELTGTASNATSVTVVIAPTSEGDKEWNIVSTGSQNRIQTAAVTKGKWTADFKGIDGGFYTVLIYDAATHVFLGTNSIQVHLREQPTIPGFNIPVTVGVGQIAFLDIFTVHVKSVSGSTAVVSFDLRNAFGGKTYTAKVGDQLPSAGVGFDYDVVTYTQSINVLIKNISSSGKTVTFVLRPLPSAARPF